MIAEPEFKAPFPWFGGKSLVAPMVWDALGAVENFVEPFLGSAAVLLARPGWYPGVGWIETANDADGYLANFWRAVRADPGGVAECADWPVSECDLHARHLWLLERKAGLPERLMGDPEFYDAKIAGWWAWGMACWIGGGFCSGNGPWVAAEDPETGERQLVHLGDAGQGVNRKRVHLGNAGQGVNRKRVHLGNAGQGVNRKRVHLGNAGQGAGQGAGTGAAGLLAWMEALAERFARVRVCCGDWERVCGPTPTVKQGLTGIFLDPPYGSEANRTADIYATDSLSVASRVRRWCLERGDDPRIRIVLAGYEGEHDELEAIGWACVPWKAHGGYGSRGTGLGRANATRERLWFSPYCLDGRPAVQQSLFPSSEW